MCGIAGLISREFVSGDVLVRLSERLRHRGSDDEGYFCVPHETLEGNFYSGEDSIDRVKSKYKNIKVFSEENGAVCLLHRRLSIIDLSELGHQPMINEDGTKILVYNGEVYNYLELRKELQDKGYNFKSKSDSEVVLKSYEHWGEKCFQKFVGMWALAIYDLNRNELLLCRDRFGIKPLYYANNNLFFAFSSEIKALFELKEIQPRANNIAVAEYLSYGSVSKPFQNLYDGVIDLEPGTYLKFNVRSGNLVNRSYYDLADNVKKIKGHCSYKDFQAALSDSINLHLRSDVPVGTCLSGGLDSSAIVSIMAPKIGGKFIDVFTASYKEKDIDESFYAKKVKDNFSNINGHETFPSATGFLNDINELIYYQDLPIGSTSMYAHWEVMKLVGRTGIKVVLNGQGSDEALGGYESFGGIYLLNLLKKMRFKGYSVGKRLLEDRFKPNMNPAIKRAMFGYLPDRIQHIVRGRERIGMGFVSNDFLIGIKPPNRIGTNFTNHGLLSFKYGLYDLLRYEDRNSMAFSIESRVPFLHHKVVELALAIPEEEKMFKGWSKYPLRQMIKDKLPSEVVWRKGKKGFATPMQEWKKEIMPILVNYISQADLPEILNRENVLETTRNNFDNPSHLSEFWRMFSFLKWVERFNVKFN